MKVIETRPREIGFVLWGHCQNLLDDPRILAANATNEKTFSALRRIKTYLQSTMTQTGLYNLLTLHMHTHKTDALDLTEITNKFTSSNEKCKLALT